MSNKPRRESVPTPADLELKAQQRTAGDAADNNRQRMLMLGGLAAAVVLAIVAAFALNADDSDPNQDDVTATAGDADTSADPGANSEAEADSETAAVDVVGDPLPPYEAEAATDNAVGTPAPSFTASTFDGTQVTIDPADGEGRMIGFFAHWCPHCQREVPTVNQWVLDSGVPEGVELIAVSTAVDDSADNYPPSAWFETEGFPGTVVRDSADSTLASDFGLTSFPFWVVTDGSGNVVARASGEQSPEALSALAALARG